MIAAHRQVIRWKLGILRSSLDKHAIFPLFEKSYLLAVGCPLRHLSLAMLLVLVKLTCVNGVIRRSQNAFSILHIVLPLAFVPILPSREYLPEAVPLVSFPLADVQILIVIVTVALALPQIVLPLTMVLEISPLLLIRAVKYAISVPDIPPVDKDLPFVMIAVAIGVLRHHPMSLLREFGIVSSPGHRGIDSCLMLLVSCVNA